MRNFWLSSLLLSLLLPNLAWGAEVEIGDPNTSEHASVEARGTVGALTVQIVDGSGSQITSFGGSGGTSHSDDAAFTIGSASSITPAGYIADDTSPDSVDEGDAGIPRMTLTRKAYAVISDNDAEQHAEVDASGHLQVDIAADSAGIGGGTQYAEDAVHGSGNTGTLALIVRQDSATQLADTDGDNSVLINDASGRLHVLDANSAAIKTAVEIIDNVVSGSEAQVDVVAALPTGSNTIGTVNLSATDNAVLDDIVDGTLAVQVDGDALTALQLIDNSISGSETQVDVVAALPAGTNAIGKVDHPVTGLADGVKTVTTAGTDEAIAGSTSCKWVVVQSQTDNTGLIAVGATGVDATEATGTGITLYPGDSISLDIDNLADVFVDSTVNGEGVRFFYGT